MLHLYKRPKSRSWQRSGQWSYPRPYFKIWLPLQLVYIMISSHMINELIHIDADCVHVSESVAQDASIPPVRHMALRHEPLAKPILPLLQHILLATVSSGFGSGAFLNAPAIVGFDGESGIADWTSTIARRRERRCERLTGEVLEVDAVPAEQSLRSQRGSRGGS